MKSIKKICGVVLGLLAVGCSSSDDDTNSGENLSLKAKAIYTNAANRLLSGEALNDGVAITSFKVNIKEIEFEFAEIDDDDDDDNDDDNFIGDDDGFYNGDDEFELNGPFELDLLNQTSVITTVSVPNGVYEEVEFELDRNDNPASSMFGKSIEFKGTINGVPFVFWHSIEEDYEIDFEDTNQNLVVTNNNYEVVINFDLNQVLSLVNISNANDGNGDGVIEISPSDPDGNQSLANQIKNAIKNSCELDD